MNAAKDLSWNTLWKWINPSRAHNPLESMLPGENQSKKWTYRLSQGWAFQNNHGPSLKPRESCGDSVPSAPMATCRPKMSLQVQTSHISSHCSWKGTFLVNGVLWLSFEWKIKWKMAKLEASESISGIQLMLPRFLQRVRNYRVWWWFCAKENHLNLNTAFQRENYKVLFPSAVKQELSCLPHGCLFLWLWGLVMPWSTEKKPGTSGVFAAVLAKIHGEDPQSLVPSYELLKTPCEGLQKCRLTGPLLMRWLVATSSILWEILGWSFRQTKLEEKIICALIYFGY